MTDETLGPTLPGDSEPDATESSSSSVGQGRVIGKYRLLQKVGEGGMGEVWEAEQVRPVKRRVAVKVIKHGMDTQQVVARFESERQALAMMDHACIAKVFDGGGTPRGRPFFVMEFVPGVPITKHCDKFRLDTQARLELFIRVCEGVQHAHQKAIIHRDIKPSNVLIAVQDSDVTPKIIDFGIAKATAQRLTERTMFTELGQMIGTPEFMSPEQAEMGGQNIDTRTDVYSLGVLLYVLLVGALPFDSEEFRSAGFDEIRRKIREDEPFKPSTRINKLGDSSTDSASKRGMSAHALRSELKGDLDWIVMKAIEKDRTRRYGSPSELAADIRRYLDDEPVLASPPSALYRTRKFVRRHRYGVATGATLLTLLLVLAVSMTVQASRIARERDRANQEAETARRVSEFLVGLFEVSDPSEALGNSITAREILDEGAGRVQRELRDQPAVQARMMETMGRVYRSLGLYEQARPLLEESLTIARRDLGGDHPDTAQNLQSLATLLLHTGDYEQAESLYERALAIREAEYGPEHLEVAAILNNMGTLRLQTGNEEEARRLYERALAIREEQLGPDHPDVGQSLNNLAMLFGRQRDFEQAREYYERGLSIMEKNLGPEHPDVAQGLNNLAILFRRTGDNQRAREAYERALAIREKVLGPDHPKVAQTLNNLAILHELDGDHQGARSLHERALAIRERSLGPEHTDVAQTLTNLGNLLKAGGDYDAARPLYERALRIRESALSPEHRKTVLTLYNLAGLAALQGDRSNALELLRTASDRGLDLEAIFDDPDFASLSGMKEFEEILVAVRTRIDAG